MFFCVQGVFKSITQIMKGLENERGIPFNLGLLICINVAIRFYTIKSRNSNFDFMTIEINANKLKCKIHF